MTTFKKSMQQNAQILFFVVLGLLLIAIPSTVCGQGETDTEEEFDHLGKIFAQLETWVNQPIGADFAPATLDGPTVFDTKLLGINPSTETRFRTRAGYRLKDNMGEILVTYTSMDHSGENNQITPGTFQYGILLTSPHHAGVFNDGKADGFTSSAGLKTRDLRIDFFRQAFKGHRISAKWYVGYRRVIHERTLDASYFALAPDIPNLLNPIANPGSSILEIRLSPRADVATQSADYNGRGIEGGMEFKFPIGISRKLMAEADIGLAVLRGKVDSIYRSTTHRYVLRDTGGNFLEELGAPYSEFEVFLNPEVPNSEVLADQIRQQDIEIGLNTTSDPGASFVIDMALGLRWRAWQNLDVFGGMRQSYYGNIGIDLRPRTVVPAGNIIGEGVDQVLNISDASKELKSITYEGLYFGVAYTF
jgi:hypothetical protein